MEAFGSGTAAAARGFGGSCVVGTACCHPLRAPPERSKPWPAVADVCHLGRQGRCAQQLGDSFCSVSLITFRWPKSLFSLSPVTLMSPVSLWAVLGVFYYVFI